MEIKVKKLRLVIALLAALVAGCTKSKCNDLVASLAPEDAIKIEEWIESQRPFEEDKGVTPLLPGDKSISIPLHDIPLNKIFRPKSASVVSGINREEVAVFLGYRDFQGIVISITSEGGFIQVPVSPMSLHAITSNTAIVCLGRD